MAEKPDKYDTSSWTGESDAVAAKALAIALTFGALGFLLVGLIALS
jgi:hypothetical protein